MFSGLFLPNYNASPSDVSTMDWWRWFVDARMCTGWYILTAAVWYGTKVSGGLRAAWCRIRGVLTPMPCDTAQIGLFRMPVRVAHYVAPLPFVLHFFGVATLRIYPSLNRAGVDLPSAIFLLLFRYVRSCTATRPFSRHTC